MFNTFARSAMNDLPAPRQREPVAGPWFMHTREIYVGGARSKAVRLDGVAREIWVTEAGFRRFFEISEEDHIENWWTYINKKLSETVDVVGKIFKGVDNRPKRFQIIFIDHSHGALMGHAVRTTISKETSACN